MNRRTGPSASPPQSRKPALQATHEGITGAVEAAYSAYTRRSGAWLKGYEARGGRVFCGAGCFGCCNMPIRVSLAEALVMARALSTEQGQAVRSHAEKVIQNARTARSEEEYVSRHRQSVGYCPILDPATGGCSRYEARPTRCRDTFSALPAVYCEAGTWDAMTRRERDEYRRVVARTPGTDGELHFIAPLEHLSEPVWAAAAKVMRKEWGLEVWGDFWVLTTLAFDPAFMAAVTSGQARSAWSVAAGAGFAHPELLEFAD